MKYYLTLATCLIYSLNQSQVDFNNYINLKCKGLIPNIFTQNLEEKIKNNENYILNANDNYTEIKRKKEFAIKASYNLNQMLLNGQVLFGDQLSNYINDINKEILNNVNIENEDKIEVFIVKSPYVNAYTTNNGKIFISTGLVAQLETEAQLAFIICHEIAHFTKKHVIDKYLYNEEVNEDQKYIGGSNALLKKSHYSQKNELEADEVGLELFLNTKYNTASIIGVFDILSFSHLPIDDIKFDPSYLTKNEDFVKVISKEITDSIPEIKVMDEKENSTHPSSEKRLEEIEKLLAAKQKNGKHNLLGEERFIEARNIARFELTDILIEKELYAEALYNNYVISKDFKKSYYLDYTNAQALYYLSKKKQRYKFIGNENVFNEIYTQHNDSEYNDDRGYHYLGTDQVQGESYNLYKIIEKTPQVDFTLMSVNYLWNMYQKHNSTYFKDMAYDIFKEVIYNEELDSSKFQRINKKLYIENIAKNKLEKSHKEKQDQQKGYKRSRKYKNIEKKIQYVHTEQEDGSVKIIEENLKYFLFVDNFKSPEFVKMFKQVFEFKDLKKKEKEKKKEEIATKTKRQIYEENQRIKKSLNFSSTVENSVITYKNANKERIGLNSLIFINPVHLYLNVNKEQKFRIRASNSKQKKLADMIEESSKSVQIDLTLLDNKNLTINDVEKFNDLVAINKMKKQLQKFKTMDSLILSNQTELEKICKKYGANHIAWNVMISIKDISKCLTCPCPKSTYNYLYIFDVEKNQLVYIKKDKMRSISNAAIRQNIYYNLSQLKKSKKN